MSYYCIKNHEDIFDSEKITTEDHFETLRNRDIFRYRTKTIKSGPMLEVEIYPLYKTRKLDFRAAKEKESRKAQKNLNNKNTIKRVTRLINANFTKKDIWGTFTYDETHFPEDEKEAQKNIRNYIRRLKGYCKKNDLPDLKYIYVTEYINDEKKGQRVHHHIVMNFPDRDIAEKYWNRGSRTQTRRLQPDDYGLEGLARYITKESKDTAVRKSSKKYATSLNLEKPKETIADHKVTKKRAASIARDPNSAKEIFEKQNQGYIFNDLEVKYSKYVSGVYLYVRMRKAPSNLRW